MSKKFRLQHSSPAPGHCSYRLLDPAGQEIPWVRQFLDAQCLRGLSPRSLRIYAYDFQLQDADLSLGQVRVWGKGGKPRILPLPEDTLSTLQNCLLLERPFTTSPFLFVSMKGPKRGHPMNSAGLRSLFRHHRRKSRVPLANPHAEAFLRHGDDSRRRKPSGRYAPARSQIYSYDFVLCSGHSQ